MKVLIHYKDYEKVKNSGVGKAICHQISALEKNNIDYTLDENDDYDVCHINTIFPSSVIFARKAMKKGKAVVYHAHSTEEDFKNSFLLSNQVSSLFKKWLEHCYECANLILTPSEYSKSLLTKYGLTKPIRVVSNGIDLDFWIKKEEDRKNFYKKYHLDPNKKSIISVGLFIKRKGILDFVELAKRLPQYEFIWFGSLNLNYVPKEIRDAVNEKLPNLHFPGYVDSEALREAYSGSDLYIFPTYEETEGIVLLEALAVKTNIIVRDIEIYKNTLVDHQNIYKAKDIEEFYCKIIKILEGELPDLSEEGYKIAQKKSLVAVGQELKKLYEEAIEISNNTRN